MQHTDSQPRPPSAGTEVTGTAELPSLAYTDHGGDGPPLLLLHGVGSSGRTWDELLGSLDGFRVITSDMRGHGSSATSPPPYVLDDLVADQIRVADELGLDTVHVVGFSIGAIIGQGLALQHPGRVASLALLSGIAGRLPDERERALDRLQTVRTSDPAVVARSSVSRWFTDGFALRRPDLVDAEVAIVSATDPVGYAACYEVLATTDLIDELAGIGTETLIMTGEHDVGSTPRMSAEMHRRIPRSRLEILPDLRHYIHIEGCTLVAGRLGTFLGDLTS